MSKLDRLWRKFNRIKRELDAAKDQANYALKQSQLLDVYDQIQEIESKLLVWGGFQKQKTGY